MAENILQTIAAHARTRVAADRAKISLEELKALCQEAGPGQGEQFVSALNRPGLSFLCEIKKASPSKGLISPDFPYLDIARAYEAAGADGVLQDRELEDFCYDDRHAKTLSDMLESCHHQGELTLSRGGCLKGNQCRRAKDLTARGQQQRDELLGLKRYLLDFSLLAERDVKETFLWQEYMVYAALLGVAKQVMEQLRRLYPGQLDQVEQYQRYLQSTAHWNAYLAGAVERQRQESQAARFGGGGGIASLGGGGGASGGGGMGTR